MIRTKTTKRWIRERSARLGRAVLQAFERQAQFMANHHEIPGLPRH